MNLHRRAYRVAKKGLRVTNATWAVVDARLAETRSPEQIAGYPLMLHVQFKTAQAVSEIMISLLTPFTANVHTLTTDNRKEFAQYSGEYIKSLCRR